MKKFVVTLLIAALILINAPPFMVLTAQAMGSPFLTEDCSFYVWDDLSTQKDVSIPIPADNASNSYIYYSSGAAYSYEYSGQQLKVTSAQGYRSTLFTTGKTADIMATRDVEGFGCYINNHTSSAFLFEPVVVGNDYYTVKGGQTVYLYTNTAQHSAVQCDANGRVSIPAGFEGHIAIPFSAMRPNWGYVSEFVPGVASINYLTINMSANFTNNGSNYILYDNMFLYGGKNAYKQELITGIAGDKGMKHVDNPFEVDGYKFNIYNDFSSMPDMTIPLPAQGENDYVYSQFGVGTHSYAYKDEQLRITQADNWKYIHFKTGNGLSATQSVGVEGLGFYVHNKTGRTITMEPVFTGDAIYRPSLEVPLRLVDIDGYSNEETTADWSGIIAVPAGFEGYVLVPVESLQQGFVPGTSYLTGFALNIYIHFESGSGQYIAFDNAFVYGRELTTYQEDAVETLLPKQENPDTPSLQEVAADIPNEGYDSLDIIGIDQFGRTFETSTGINDEKHVGMFFWLWMGQPTHSDIYDMTEFMKTTQGANELFNKNSTVAPVNQAYYWGEPLFGYYNSSDEYVLRKQAEMLTLANIDFLIFDSTNAITYPHVYRTFFKILEEYQQDGWDVPRIAFYTHSRSMATTERLYYDLYKPGYFSDIWYYYKGKPMIISYTDIPDDYKEALSRDDYTYYTNELPDEILDFFTFKYPQWPNEGINHDDGVPYVEWEYPQPIHNNWMNVSAASQHYACMSNSYTHPGVVCWGRGFDFKTNTNITADARKGTFFQSQWNQVHYNDIETVFIDGWNEWVGYKIDYHGSIVFVDAFCEEYSRDIEPMKGGYGDAFYLQTIDNIRNFKEYLGKNYISQGKTINLSGSVSQWDTGVKLYRAFDKNGYGRDAYDAAGKNRYVTDPPRNNIQEVRVVNDVNNVYFYILCSDDITQYDGSNNWMNVLIGTGDPAKKGFNGYEYVVNRSVNTAQGTTSIHKLNSDFSGSVTGSGNIKVNGRIMTISIPRSVLGLYNGRTDGANIYFKVADNITNPENIENYYISGKSVPMGNLSYSYAGVEPTQTQTVPDPFASENCGIYVYEDFSGRADMTLPLAQNEYFWEAPNAASYEMRFTKQRLAITKAPSGETSRFMLHMPNATPTGTEALHGMQGVGLYVKNNTEGAVTLSPYYVGAHAFYVSKGKNARLATMGGNSWEITDSGAFASQASFVIPAGFEGYLLLNISDFFCGWHSGCVLNAESASIGYFSMQFKPDSDCSPLVGTSIIFDNLFFYGDGMTPYKQELIKNTTTPAENSSYGIQYVTNMGTLNGASVSDVNGGSTLHYNNVQDGRKAVITGGNAYNMVAFNLRPGGSTVDCSNAEGIGFYAENNTSGPLSFQPIIPNNSYSLLRSYVDYYLVDMQKNVTYCQSTPYINGGGNITLPANFKGYVLTSLRAYGNWWYGSSEAPYFNQALKQFGFRGTMNLTSGSLVLTDVFLYGCAIENDNRVVDILPSTRDYAFADGDEQRYSYTDSERLQPFWQSNVIRNESATFVQENGVISAKLLFVPENIISLRSNDFTKEYIRGTDWEYDAKTQSLIRLPGSSIPYFTQSQLAGLEGHDGCGATGKIGNALYCVGHYLYERQLSVSYSYDYQKYSVPATEFDESLLPLTLQKLRLGQSINVGCIGDSIMQGCDASSIYYRAPYLPAMDQLVKQGLEQYYGATVNMYNLSVGGTNSTSSMAAINSVFATTTPDLILICYGQNDSQLTPTQTKQNIQEAMAAAKAKNPNVEFIVISTLNANYDAGFRHHQYEQSVELAKLKGPGVAYVDANALHSYCLLRKRYVDVSGNNINHPNDFLIRAMAGSVLSAMIDY